MRTIVVFLYLHKRKPVEPMHELPSPWPTSYRYPLMLFLLLCRCRCHQPLSYFYCYFCRYADTGQGSSSRPMKQFIFDHQMKEEVRIKRLLCNPPFILWLNSIARIVERLSKHSDMLNVHSFSFHTQKKINKTNDFPTMEGPYLLFFFSLSLVFFYLLSLPPFFEKRWI